MGILNGTTNYILTKMAEEGSELDEALALAQEKGYAEADPTADVDGYDAQYKLAILGSIGFHQTLSPSKVYREGIRLIAKRDMEFADLLGYRIKLLGIVESLESGVSARVHPTLIPKDHPLADVRDVYNAVWMRGDFVGDLMFSGRGAGGDPTGSAVIGDVIDVCRNIRIGGAGNAMLQEGELDVVPMHDLVTRYYLRLIVLDAPKVLGCIATVFGNCDVSLAAMEMRTLPRQRGELVFLTHPCQENAFLRGIKALKNLHVVEQVVNWIRVEE
jgi:homoserine dehydrogenase